MKKLLLGFTLAATTVLAQDNKPTNSEERKEFFKKFKQDALVFNEAASGLLLKSIKAMEKPEITDEDRLNSEALSLAATNLLKTTEEMLHCKEQDMGWREFLPGLGQRWRNACAIGIMKKKSYKEDLEAAQRIIAVLSKMGKPEMLRCMGADGKFLPDSGQRGRHLCDTGTDFMQKVMQKHKDHNDQEVLKIVTEQNQLGATSRLPDGTLVQPERATMKSGTVPAATPKAQ